MCGRPQPKAKYQLLLENSRSSFDARHIVVVAVLIISIIGATTIATFLLWENVQAVEDTAFLLEMVKISDHQKFSTAKQQQLSYLYSTSLRECMNSSEDIATFDALTKSLPVPAHSKSNSLKLVCYYNVPSTEHNDLQPENIDPFLCTHINIGFASVHNSTISVTPKDADIYHRVAALKIRNPALKVLLSIGGASEDTFGIAEMVSSRHSREIFIRNIFPLLSEYNFDGIDFDWEFPAWMSDKLERPRFAQLLTELRAEIMKQQPSLLLSVAVAAPQPIIDKAYDIPSMAKSVDFVNVMSYDYHSYLWYLPVTGMNAPLYSSSKDTGYMRTLNVNFTAWYWNYKGMPAEKIVVGLPTYGHSFTLVNGDNHEIGAPSSGFGIMGKGGFISYADACWFVTDGKAAEVFDLETRSPYAYRAREWVSFDNEQSLSYKAQYVVNSHFGGAMILSLQADDYNGTCTSGRVTFPLTRQVANVLQDDQL